eukprot:6186863-Pleurochrysis_carterae.AAC.1
METAQEPALLLGLSAVSGWWNWPQDAVSCKLAAFLTLSNWPATVLLSDLKRARRAILVRTPGSRPLPPGPPLPLRHPSCSQPDTDSNKPECRSAGPAPASARDRGRPRRRRRARSTPPPPGARTWSSPRR